MSDRKICMTTAWDEIIKFNETYFPGWRGIDEIYYSNALAWCFSDRLHQKKKVAKKKSIR